MLNVICLLLFWFCCANKRLSLIPKVRKAVDTDLQCGGGVV